MHYFQRKLHLLLLFIKFLLTSSDYSLYFTKTTLADAIHHLELIDELLVTVDSYGDFVCIVHTITLFEKLIVC